MRWTAAALAFAFLAVGGANAHAAGTLELYKMVRSLQLVQDQLARGDHAAMPMQQKMLAMIDERFRTAGTEEFEDRRNLTALLVYAMSGGNPTTIEVVLSKLRLEGEDAVLGKGVLAYMTGQMAKAGEILAPIDPMARGSETGAFVALVKGSIMGIKRPEAALKLMDQARLLAPGTLVEEAALRRSLPLVLALERPDRFLVLAEQYTRRFLRSPYASEFADAFVEGMVTFHDAITEKQIETIVSLMNPAQQEAIYLRLARRSTIKGQVDRSAFASSRATAISRQVDGEGDPRATLYQAISSITSENVEEVLENLEKVDPDQLSPRDRRLLLAARAIAAEVLALPTGVEPSVEEASQPAVSKTVASHASEAAGEETLAHTPTGSEEHPAPAISAEAALSEKPLEEVDTVSQELVSSVREKLDAVDRLLGEVEK